ncbi:MAG: helix-turn-helix transcriptional regulator [Lachnospiraceae bacterium]|nr:helix-turn-helix transcriptional regulator [Lachnospiraceae bacterium]
MADHNNSEELIKELGKKIKIYRIFKEMSQQELADKTGVSKRSISRLEQGEAVNTDILFKILLALGLGDNIENLIPDQTKRPAFYLDRSENTPKRVGKRSGKKGFKWGDEN